MSHIIRNGERFIDVLKSFVCLVKDIPKQLRDTRGRAGRYQETN